MRWECISVFHEQDLLALLPVLVNGNYLDTMFGNSTLGFAGKSVGRPFYSKHRNNFSPDIGLARNVRGKGKTTIRMGCSMNYVQDSQSTAIRNSVVTNAGLAQTVQSTGLSSALSSPTALASRSAPSAFTCHAARRPWA